MHFQTLLQYISAMGQEGYLLLIDCRTHQYTLVPYGAGAECPIILVTNSNVKHQLTGSEYPDRVKQCKDAVRILQNAFPDVKVWYTVYTLWCECGFGVRMFMLWLSRSFLHHVGEHSAACIDEWPSVTHPLAVLMIAHTYTFFNRLCATPRWRCLRRCARRCRTWSTAARVTAWARTSAPWPPCGLSRPVTTRLLVRPATNE